MVGLGLLWSRVTGKTYEAKRDRRSYSPAAMHPRREHEHRDVSVGWILGVVLFLAIGGVAIHFIMAGFLHVLNRTQAPTDQWRPAQASAFSADRNGNPPAYPMLQVSPPLDLERFRTKEDKHLSNYGWVNQSSGVVHIPITAAMDLLLKKGLPVRNSAQQQQPGPSSYELMLQRVGVEEAQRQPPGGDK